jgi:hypothetical protein
MKIIFLDIDGVICNREQWRSRVQFEGLSLCNFDQESVKLLNQLTDKTGAEIVISSTWRRGSEEDFTSLMFWFRNQGVTGRIMDRTPVDNSDNAQRGDEIKQWLNANFGRVDAFVVLDDDSDMRGVEDHFVQTLIRVEDERMLEEGLKQIHVDKAIAILDKPIVI